MLRFRSFALIAGAGFYFAVSAVAITKSNVDALTVGPADSGCGFTDLQTAIDSLDATHSTVHVRTDYTGGPISITNRDAHIVGGFTECGDASPADGAMTRLEGSLSTADSAVIAIDTTAAPRDISLDHLSVLFGHHGVKNGGGIAVVGAGTLSIGDALIQNNQALNGGAINANGSDLTITIKGNTTIEANNADVDGGGIRIEGRTTLKMLSDFTIVIANAAGGNGGGLEVTGAGAHAEIGSPGLNAGGVITSNAAAAGGGISIEHGAVARLFSAVPGKPASINGNSAQLGGAIYINAKGAGGPGTLCGFGFAMQNNIATNDGGAIYADADQANSAVVLLTRADTENSGACGPALTQVAQDQCPAGRPCNIIADNEATTGAAISIQGAHFSADQVQFQNVVVPVDGLSEDAMFLHVVNVNKVPGASAQLHNCLISDIQGLSGGLLQIENKAALDLDGCTITNNQTFAPALFAVDGPLTVKHSIIWQPDAIVLGVPAFASFDFSDVIISDAENLDPRSFVSLVNVHSGDPQFLDSTNDDVSQRNYRIVATSPAIDYSSTPVLLAVDLDGFARGHALSANTTTPFDVGAFERQGFVPSQTFPSDENFEELDNLELTPGLLPRGWQSEHSGAGSGWVSTRRIADAGALAGFIDDVPDQSDSSLVTPSFAIAQNAQLRFRQLVSLENDNDGKAFDGAVLEIKIAGGDFEDIVLAGGNFLLGGYNAVIVDTAPSAIAGRSAWSGHSGAYQDVVVELPASANGKTVQLRWRMATDDSGRDEGYWIDNIHIDLDRPEREVIFANDFDPR
jgi:predicted outer membrane repeat protein